MNISSVSTVPTINGNIITFNSSSTFVLNNNATFDVLIVGGGGYGTGYGDSVVGSGGGGGAIGMGTITFLKNIVYTITIGTAGNNSSIIGDKINETANCGGNGSFYSFPWTGSGGSGGSGTSLSSGNMASMTYYTGGNGGSAGGTGAGGNGSIGKLWSITNIYYGGGGGGGGYSSGGNGGLGGGAGGGFVFNDINIITSNSSNIIIFKNSYYQINNESLFNIEDGNYNIIFDKGSLILNNTNNNKYKLIYDSNNKLITTIAWYKFDDITNIGF